MKYLILICINMFTAHLDIPVCYIEYTNMTLAQRKHFHYYHSQLDEPKEYIHREIKYVGAQHFKWEILDTAETEDEAIELTKYYQDEYKSYDLGYNKKIDEENPRYDDHRTWEELHGKEKAEEMKKKQSETFKNLQSLSDAMKKRLEVWNPMDDPKAREKVRQSKLGTKNPKAEFDYIFTKEDGSEFCVECLRQFCKENEGFSRNGITQAIREKRKYKNMSIRKVLKKKKDE